MNPFSSKLGLLVVALTLIALCGVFVLVLVPPPHPLEQGGVALNASSTPTDTVGEPAAATTPAATTSPDLSDLIVVTSPKSGAIIGTSSLTVTGKARGSFYFEASFPVYLTDWDGRIIAQGQAHAQGDWMTSDFVPFTATLTYTVPAGSNKRGTLILHNDNPSGDPARDKALELPIVFP
jgi:Immunoglobulin-like domain of bacterial spore germination